MDFDHLMEFIKGDEEMGLFELYGNDCLINIVTIRGKKVLDIHFFEQHDNEYTSIKEALDSNGMKYYRSQDLKLKSEKITVDAEATCTFSLYEQEEKLSMKAEIVQEYFELTDIGVNLEIIRRSGKKTIEIAFFFDFSEYSLLSSFLNCNGVDFFELHDDFMGEHLKVKLVRCNFVPMKAKKD